MLVIDTLDMCDTIRFVPVSVDRYRGRASAEIVVLQL
jgi:hypothetical protein